MLHEARDRQKFLSDAQTLRDMQHKVESEYQACLRGQESRRDSSEKKRDPFGGQETNAERARFLNGSSSKQSSSEEDLQAQPGLSAKSSSMNYDSRLPAIDQTSVKQKHKSTMTARQPGKVGSSKPSPGDSREHPLFWVEHSPYCSVFAFSPALQPNTSYCCLLLPLVPPASQEAQGPSPHLPRVSFPHFAGTPDSLSPVPQSPAALCYFPISTPAPSEIPVVCLPGPQRPSKLYLLW
uniref:RING-type E3 ubiquitin transferase n=1 Tax=Pipistrellus kuhlii TaxID=59472 RepID=A0A7J7U8E3_PIPKU|nr:hypothetical protein mPipKuh1_011241 [Pipistrellus kuhlii]